jgi:hypothetical protein
MRRNLIRAVFAAMAATLAVAGPAMAHGDHDARALVRGVPAGPYTVSLWQVYREVDATITPHLIVMLDGATTPDPVTAVTVAADGTPLVVGPSTTTSNGWETTEGVGEGTELVVAISDGQQTWSLEPVVVPPPPTSLIPMVELIYVSIFLTAATAIWMARRATRAWRRPGRSIPAGQAVTG